MWPHHKKVLILSELGNVFLKKLYLISSWNIEDNRAKHDVCQGRRERVRVRVGWGGFHRKDVTGRGSWYMRRRSFTHVGVSETEATVWAAAPNPLWLRDLLNPVHVWQCVLSCVSSMWVGLVCQKSAVSLLLQNFTRYTPALRTEDRADSVGSSVCVFLPL